MDEFPRGLTGRSRKKMSEPEDEDDDDEDDEEQEGHLAWRRGGERYTGRLLRGEFFIDGSLLTALLRGTA